ncbi:MAG: hypothetical protein IPK12_23875 [Gemmatimonadetes bacterium]|nr:hypothetical protein [Gemmatimonadota bacterium]
MPDTLWAESNEQNVLATDSELAKVRQELLGIAKRLKRPIGILLGDIVRQAIDEVVDGPRTGRWDIDQLTKTEKTYIGTKVEIIVRNELDLDAGQASTRWWRESVSISSGLNLSHG